MTTQQPDLNDLRKLAYAKGNAAALVKFASEYPMSQRVREQLLKMLSPVHVALLEAGRSYTGNAG